MEHIKFIIWGAGHRCQELMGYLGKDYIEAIIDEDVRLQGAIYCGVPVISKEEYLIEFCSYPVIVTPLNAEESIKFFLDSKGVSWNFSYWGNTRTEIGSFMVQAPLEKLTMGYKEGSRLLIYGWSALTLVVYEFFNRKGLDCCIMLPEKTDPMIEDYVKNVLGIKTVTKQENLSKQRIVLAMKPSEQDDVFLNKNKMEVITYYDLTLKKELYSNIEIRKFHNIHKGKRVFIVATGPSLLISDLDKLNESNELCISMNKIYKGFPYTDWRPDYYIAVDSAPITEYKTNIRQCGKRGIFIGDLAWNLIDDIDICNIMYKWHVYNWWEDNKSPLFTDDFSKGSYWGMTITYDALQLAVYMGFSEIYLIGVDCCKYDKAENQHFVKDYSEKLANIRERESMISYGSAKKYADLHGIKIYNATRGGNLEVFERVDFDRLF